MIDRSDTQWYRDAIIYQVHVKSFFDSDDDGMGDFIGLTEKLDYIKELGATAIWLMPFYPSPLRDDGYDIADYRSVNPSYGSMRDFRKFVREAHERGIRVIIELVINHTSDQHPWFQRARRAKPGSAARNFYVWADTDQQYAGTRIIFLDTEKSNWSWDPVAQAYYWHRFYAHQPDLNFDNPRVLEAVVDTMHFWLDMGVDGMRLDAIPYIIEREGTNCENLPETHDVIKKIRAALDERYPDRMLLAEANQWPEDTAPYFGDGDECHMAFHFPLMPRMYMAVAQEERNPITDIMRQTPDIPANCQWAIFLRNHDELTLEMVTEKERDYLWKFYAADSRARINLGIRRRLAPLLENDRRKTELLVSLLLSMPGTPVLYYGDEIGMGDNIYLGDRDGVRTPMQWSPDRNGGFSRSDPARLFLPAIQDPIYGFNAVNVESQRRSPSSLLNWLKRLIAVRHNSRAFGRGTLRFLYPENRKILAYVRELDSNDRVLCVANLSRGPQAVELDLSDYKGIRPVEMTAGSVFPRIGDLSYLLTLPGYGFYWFKLDSPSTDEDRFGPRAAPELFTLVLAGPPEDVLTGRERVAFERNVMPPYVASRRWFGGKTTRIVSATIADTAVIDSRDGKDKFLLPRLDVKLRDGQTQDYFTPLAIDEDDEDEALLPYAVARLRRGPRMGLLFGAASSAEFALTVVAAMKRGQTVATQQGGEIRFVGTRRLEAYGSIDPLDVARLGAEQSNTSIALGSRMVLKLYRRLQDGPHPEIEVGHFLTDVAGFANTPALLGWMEHIDSEGTTTALAVLQRFVRNQGDAWRLAVEATKREIDQLVILPPDEMPSITQAFGIIGHYAVIIGQRTAEMHLAFATPTTDAAFAAEPLAGDDVSAMAADARGQAARAFSALKHALAEAADPNADRPLSDTAIALIEALLQREADCFALISRLDVAPVGALKTRVHGDYHLGQVLIVADDVTIVDFEGEPSRPADERRRKTTPLRDVAGMLRSFSYMAETAVRQLATTLPETGARARAIAAEWEQLGSRSFLDAYEAACRGSPVWTEDAATQQRLLALALIGKALYEINYEANNRPDWIEIPIRGVLSILDQETNAQ
ncbi:maltose alpha-D-glucosyltransferase [Chelatococcus reniformis]|uniref:maltose alpha-D-glucosyltransferase n=1 Tax=Chelatococcus reniformis TaxID=1494448 RepID=A0A916TZV5_9HYPH|nr:maltose alpha-D-glucosyltransferase [Chelatococcus reniformis]GGC54563.1 alpha-amylase [Chelatococcus reniformis]